MPSPRLVQEKAGNGSGSNPTIVFDDNVQPGNGIVVGIVSTITVTAVSGCGATWERVGSEQAFGGGGEFASVWVGRNAIAGGASKTITITKGAGDWAATASELRHVLASASPLDGSEVATGSFDDGTGVTKPTSGVTPGGTMNDAVAAYGFAYHATSNPTISADQSGGFAALEPRFQDAGAPRWSVAGALLTPAYGSLGVRFETGFTIDLDASWVTIAVALKGVVSAVGPLPLSIEVYDAEDPSDLVAPVEGATGIAYSDPFNAMGSGTFRLALADPKATVDVLAPNTLIDVRVGGDHDFSFWHERTSWSVASPDGEAGEFVTISGRGLEAYLERSCSVNDTSYTDESVGHILATEIGLAAADAGGLDLLTWSFSDGRDSAGVVWDLDYLFVTMNVDSGTTMLDLVNQFRAMGLIAVLRRDFVLEVYQALGEHVEDRVIFREGKHLREQITLGQNQSQRRNVIIVDGGLGNTQKLVIVNDLPDARSVHMDSPVRSSYAPTILKVVHAEYARRESEGSAFQVPVHHGLGAGEYEFGRHYRNGDWVAIDVPGRYSASAQRVAGRIVAQADAGDFDLTLDMNAVARDDLVRLAENVARLNRRV